MKNSRPIKKWIKVGKPEIILSKFGKKVVRQFFKNPDTRRKEEFILFSQPDWSAVLPLTEDGKVLTVTQYRQGCDLISAGLPGGGLDKNESPLQSMRRELKEETGFAPARVIALGSYWMTGRNSWTKFHCFLALGCKKVCEPKNDSSEQILCQKVPWVKWLERVQNGNIAESSAVIATFMSLPHIKLTL